MSLTHWIALGGGGLLILVVLIDAFETIILPRRISRRYRLTALFYRFTWPAWRGMARLAPRRRRDTMLGWYGPLSLLLLLVVWAIGIVTGFGLLQWADGSALRIAGEGSSFAHDVYFSSLTIFTLMMGDATPLSWAAKWLAVGEAAVGFGLLAIVIGYLPVIYQSFSRRETAINLLDARAGTPPTASELLCRHRDDPDGAALAAVMSEWEKWAGEVLESHLSYPVLAYFRSQHANESWLTALTAILDTSALILAGIDGRRTYQAQMTFAMARHAVVDLAQVFSARRPEDVEDRLNEAEFAELALRLKRHGMILDRPETRERLDKLRTMYEPYVTALSRHLQLALPPWVRHDNRPDNWQGAPWKIGASWVHRGNEPTDATDHF